ncbi:hypothetical protein Scep_002999 [Stephania cephalantha]|uniref:Chlororespiratory reduction 21 n=1 Tax=Stephania cephalantha TaxID=152367 RepID=A0AAP0LC97_9MAGN
MHEEALSLFFSGAGAQITPLAFAALIKSCSAIAGIELGKVLHGIGVKLGFDELNEPVSKGLMNMYAKCGSLHDCHALFDRMNGKSDRVLWNIVLSGYAARRDVNSYENVMRLFHDMRVCEEEPEPNEITFAIVISVCARVRELDSGKRIHCYVVKLGLESKTLVGNALVSMYSKCGCAGDDAFAVFCRTDHKDVVSWNALISGYAENGLFADSFELFRRMLGGSIEPNYATIVNVLPICGSRHGKEIHCFVLRRLELARSVSVNNSIVSFYARIGRLREAELLFRRMGSRDVVSWNAIIAGYAMAEESQAALELFHELLLTNSPSPDSVTLISVIPICAQLNDTREGRKIHDYVLRRPELQEDTAIGNALISFYGKCGEIWMALWTFLMIPSKDLISWNAMLDALGGSGCGGIEFIGLLRQMLNEGIRPDSITMLTVLHACSERKIKEAHAYALRTNLLLNRLEPTVGNAILDAYAKCGNMEYAFNTFKSLSGKRNVVTSNAMISGYISRGSKEDAEMIFNSMSETDITTWNLMVRAYAENESSEQAINLLRELQLRGMRPDMVSIMSILPVCACLASMHLVKQCHGYVVRSMFRDIRLNGALLDLYSKCGSINNAQKLFQLSTGKDLVMFTAMVGAYAIHGMGEEALHVFNNMLDMGIKPDHVIITAVLSACSHAGLVDEGQNLFKSIEAVHGIKPTMEHYACVVDLLARKGRLRDAYSFVIGMPIEANANVWGTLLGACRNQHEVELGRVVADHLFEVEPNNVGNYVVMSNMYAANERWDQVKEVRKFMRTREIAKPAGCSWIEVENVRHVFVVGDTSHPLRPLIYSTLCVLDQLMKRHIVEESLT